MDPNNFLSVYKENNLCLESELYYALENMSTCRTIEKGGRILRCQDCGTQVVVYNPCNQRGCPVCSKKNQIQWAEKLKKKLLPTGHYHLIFSIPEELTEICKKDKKTFINSFFHSVQQAFKQLQKDMGITLGITMVFQSHSHGLFFKPHMHCIVTDHGVDKNSKWVPCGSLKYSTLRDVIKETLIPHLKKKLHPFLRKHFKKIFGVCDDRKWTVYPAIHKFNGDNIVNYLSQSVSGMVINIENDLSYNRIDETFTIRDHHLGKEKTITLDANTFWYRYLSHIPPKGTVTIRNYGLYSNKYSSSLEQIRVSEFAIETTTEETINEEEECLSCHGKRIIIEPFTVTDLPLLLRLYINKNHSPPGHGHAFKSKQKVLS